jgi:hypothetical protein
MFYFEQTTSIMRFFKQLSLKALNILVFDNQVQNVDIVKKLSVKRFGIAQQN